MCGICLLLIFRDNFTEKQLKLDCDKYFQDIYPFIGCRGPDDSRCVELSYKDTLKINLISSVLHLRGDSLEPQPVQDEKENFLLWNGEIFDGPLLHSSKSDTQSLKEKLFECSSKDDVVDVISSIYGPYAFIFYQQCNELLWFGRDIFGRRSLLLAYDDKFFKLSSVAHEEGNWQEVPTTGIFCIDMRQFETKESLFTYHFPWSKSASGVPFIECKVVNMEKFVLNLETSIFVTTPISQPLNRSLPSSESLKCFKSLTNDSDSELKSFSLLLEDVDFKNVLVDFENVLFEAVKKRVHNQPNLCKKCYKFYKLNHELNCNHASLGVLFSGGLDSIVIAALTHWHLSKDIPIDLLNVAFDCKTKQDFKLKDYSAFDTPDRVTGRNGVTALRKLYPTRTWNFIEVNVSKEELISQRNNRISQLLKPSCTVLDDSIGCAIWFAARGRGIVASQEGWINYESPVRVLLVGMGADEQLGGYSRHRAKFNNTGWSGLIDELGMELDRIGTRNLGRDDRIIADNSVESRYPFLDESVVSFLNELPVWLKMNLNYPRGMGEKLLLRLLAYKIGLTEAAILPKRAIQFGSRIARIENSKEKGSDICERLKQTL